MSLLVSDKAPLPPLTLVLCPTGGRGLQSNNNTLVDGKMRAKRAIGSHLQGTMARNVFFRGALALGALALFAWSPEAFAQSAHDVATARTAARKCLAAYRAESYDEALDLCTRAEQLHHAVIHLVYMARANWKLGRLVIAHELYQKANYEELPSNAPRALQQAQAEAREELGQLEPLLAKLTVVVQGSEAARRAAEVTINGQGMKLAALGLPQPVDPGEYRISASVGEQRVTPEVVQLAEGETETVALTLPEPSTAPIAPVAEPTAAVATSADGASPAARDSHASTTPLVAYVSWGVGLVGAIGGTFFLLQRQGKQKDANQRYDDCVPQLCAQSTVDDIERLDDEAAGAGTLSLVGYAVGAAGLAAGTVLWLTADHTSAKLRESGDQSGSQSNVSAWLGLGSAGIRGTF